MLTNRQARIDEAAGSLQANAVDTVKDLNPGWKTLSNEAWDNAIYAQKIAQLPMFADQYDVTVEELKAELGLA